MRRGTIPTCPWFSKTWFHGRSLVGAPVLAVELKTPIARESFNLCGELVFCVDNHGRILQIDFPNDVGL